MTPTSPRGQMHPVYATFSAIAAVAIVIGSWAPFQFQSANTTAVWQIFIQRSLPAGFSRSDVIVNFWLGFPLVLGLSGLVRPHIGSIKQRLTGVWLIFVTQACVSLLAEIGQGWFVSRVPSVSDFSIQLIGATIATLLWQWRGRSVETQFELIFKRSDSRLRSTRLDAALTLTALGILAWTAMPLDLMVSPAELARKFLSTELVPFTRLEGSFPENAYQWLASFFLAVPLGLWLSRWLARRYSGQLSFFTVVLLAIAVGVLPEVCQFPIASRVASATDAFFGGLGALAGILLGRQFQSTRILLARTSFRNMLITPGFWFLLAVTQTMIICAVAWLPFDFSTDSTLLTERFKDSLSNPFQGYRGSDLLNMMTLFRQAILGAILGIFLGLAHHFSRLKSPFSFFSSATILVFVVAFPTGVELGQIAVDSRTGDSIGIFTRTTGSALGLVATFALLRQN